MIAGGQTTNLGLKSQHRVPSGIDWILRCVCLALVFFHFPSQLAGQFTDPRTYDNTPAGVNQLELIYAYTHANASIDTSLIVTGAEVNLNQGTTDFTRYFSFFCRLAWAQAGVPLAGLDGSVSASKLHLSNTGAGDSSYQFAMLLKGGPAFSVAKFGSYDWRKPHHHSAHRPISRRQGSQPRFKSLVVQARNRGLASLRR